MQWIRKNTGGLVQGTGGPRRKTSSTRPISCPSRSPRCRTKSICAGSIWPASSRRPKQEANRTTRGAMRNAAEAMKFRDGAGFRDVIKQAPRIGRRRMRESLPAISPPPRAPTRDWRNFSACSGYHGCPQHVEGFDISNISGTLSVAPPFAFRDGSPTKSITVTIGSGPSRAAMTLRRWRRWSVAGTHAFAPKAARCRFGDGGRRPRASSWRRCGRCWKLEIRDLPVIGTAKQMKKFTSLTRRCQSACRAILRLFI